MKRDVDFTFMIGSGIRTLSIRAPLDGATAAADVAYRMSELSFLFPITPSTPLGEAAERWAAEGKKNIFGRPVQITQMQSEGGAAGAIHGAAGLGALTTTFTASQGLLLMLPDIFRMAGDEYPGVFHVAARSIGTLGVSIYGDQSDIQVAKLSGVAMLGSSSPQEAGDMAAIAHAASISASYPFIHFFDGFRTSHEINTVVPIPNEVLTQMIDQEALTRFKQTSLSPEHPSQRGCIYPIELFWQFAEATSPRIAKIEPIVMKTMEQFGKLTGRYYKTFEYFGPKDATDVIVAMGSGAKTVEEYIHFSNGGTKLGVVNIHLLRPFNTKELLKVIPATAQRITVLDKSRDPLASKEGLYMEVASAIKSVRPEIKVIGGKYGISSKNFNPTHVEAVISNMKSETPIDRFCVGINDDVNHTSLPLGKIIETVPRGTKQCIFWGFGSDGTVGACKDAIKIIVDNTPLYGQAHFEYTAHKSGGTTTSYLRFGESPIVSPYLIQQADYVSCAKPSFAQRIDIADQLKEGGTIVFNAPSNKTVDEFLPARLRKKIAEKNAKVYFIDASEISNKFGLSGRTNTVMSALFFILAGVLPEDKALELLKNSTHKTYAKKGEEVVQKNINLIDAAKGGYKKIEYDRNEWLALVPTPAPFPKMPKMIEDIVPAMMCQKGNEVPVSKASTIHGDFPPGFTQFEKRGIADSVPEWDEKKCVECGLCSTLCPHAVIRPFLLTDEEVKKSPVPIETQPAKAGKDLNEMKFTIQISAYDCTGCSKCAQICPVDALHMKPSEDMFDKKQKKFNYVRSLPVRGDKLPPTSIKNTQFRQPLLEFSGACGGCGETAIVKMVSQLYGDYSYFAFATGCPLVWGGSAGSNSYTTKPNGKGPAWSQSLFEDHAEFGFGQHKALEMRRRDAKQAVEAILDMNIEKGDAAKNLLAKWDTIESRQAAEEFLRKVENGELEATEALKTEILRNKDFLSYKINWIFGGDGWAYDIGYGGLDHVLASGEPVKVIVMDTEVYSNTGGQPSKSSNRASSTSFSQLGVGRKKKDLALIAQTYRNIYVANTCLDADPKQALKAITEAAAYNGPSLIINYSPCIEQGFSFGLGAAPKHCKNLVDSGYIILSRYDPRLEKEGKCPLQMDSPKPSFDSDAELNKEVRFANLKNRLPKRAAELRAALSQDLKDRYDSYARIVAGFAKPAQ